MIHEWKTGEHHRVKGAIKINLPKYTQRLAYLRDCQFEVNGDGEVEVSNGMLDSTIKMIQIAEKHIESIDLVTESGKEINTFEQMEYEPSCESILQELGTMMLNGVPVGND